MDANSLPDQWSWCNLIKTGCKFIATVFLMQRNEDWELAYAGQRVSDQSKKDESLGGKLEFRNRKRLRTGKMVSLLLCWGGFPGGLQPTVKWPLAEQTKMMIGILERCFPRTWSSRQSAASENERNGALLTVKSLVEKYGLHCLSNFVHTL